MSFVTTPPEMLAFATEDPAERWLRSGCREYAVMARPPAAEYPAART
jgi:hypothetical protein